MQEFSSDEKRVIKTLAYYQALSDVALTPLEIHKYMPKKELYPNTTLFDVYRSLESLESKGLTKENYGFWYLKNAKKDLPEKRIQNSKHTALKWKKIAKKGRFLVYIPFVRSVAVTGSTALNNAKEKSDVDVLILTKQNSIWSTRFFVTCASFMLKSRRYGKNIENRLCFNQYTTKDAPGFGPPTLHETVKNIQTPVWDDKNIIKNDSLLAFDPKKTLLFLKAGLEKILSLLYLDKIIEFIIGRMQITKIQKNPTDYPSQLKQPSLSSKNLIFYYPKVEKTEEGYNEIIKELAV